MRRLAWFAWAVIAATGCKGRAAESTSGAASGSATASGSGAASASGSAAASGSGAASASGSSAASGSAAASGSGAASGAAVDPAKLVERGKYVANLAGCTVCHMAFGPTGPDPSKSLSGGLEIPEAFGSWRPSNITMDRSTGIGGWTDDEIITAVREGKRPDDSMLFPIMPYPLYNRMTDDDAHALVAYLRTLPAVAHKVAPNDLKLPKTPVPKPANAPDPTGDPVKHGEYLATLMHCVACHTPVGPQGPDMSKAFAGGYEYNLPMLGDGTIYSANITSDPDTGIGKYTEQNIIDVVTKLTKPDGKPVLGPMTFYIAAWSNLTDDDAKALAAYVKTIPAVKNQVPASTFKPHGAPPGGAPAGGGGGGGAPGGGGHGGAAPGGGGAPAPGKAG